MATEKRLFDASAKFIEKHFAKRLIDVYALIDVIENTDWYHINPQGKLVEGANSQRNTPLYKAADIHRALANAPIVDAVVVNHGRWLDVQETDMYVPDMKFTITKTAETCSNCKVRIGFIGAKQYLFDSVCPNCGAKMDLE